MILLDHVGGTLVLEPSEAGDHACWLKIKEDGEELMFNLRPDDAFALSATLVAWALDRTRKGGMF